MRVCGLNFWLSIVVWLVLWRNFLGSLPNNWTLLRVLEIFKRDLVNVFGSILLDWLMILTMIDIISRLLVLRVSQNGIDTLSLIRLLLWIILIEMRFILSRICTFFSSKVFWNKQVIFSLWWLITWTLNINLFVGHGNFDSWCQILVLT